MTQTILEQLLATLPSLRDFHAPTHAVYQLLKAAARREVIERFSSVEPVAQPLGPFGSLLLPYTQMGTIDSRDLFGLDELIIFSFYWANRGRYRRVLDLGGNLGLHSILMARTGFAVTCYEPDPVHFERLQRNLALNGLESVRPVNAAISTTRGSLDFIRVLGNTTGSHIAGSKANVYGPTERFPVDVVPFGEIAAGVDFVKMDVEGHEATILTSTDEIRWREMDAIVEVGSAVNASTIFQHFDGQGVNLFAQKIAWRRVLSLEDMPTSHREGSLFITCKSEVPWD
jgi:FkbM family methyltransferase